MKNALCLLLLLSLWAESGLILSKADFSSEWEYLFPRKDKALSYYGSATDNTPDGKIWTESYELKYIPTGKKDVEQADCQRNSVEYETYALIVSSPTSDRTKLKLEPCCGQAAFDIWIEKDDLEKAGYKFESFKDYFKGHKSCHAQTENGLSLRSEPVVTDNKIITLYDDTFIISFTQDVEAYWAKVKVIRDTGEAFIESKPTGEEWEGWIKYLDDDGTPNVWYYTSY